MKAALKKRSNALANLQPTATGGLPADKRKAIHAAPDSTWEVLRHLPGTPPGTANPGKQALIAELVSKTNFSTQSIFQMSRKFKLIAGSSKSVITFDEFKQIMSEDVGDLLVSIGIGSREFEELQNTDMTAIGATISSSETFLRRLFLAFDADSDGKIDFREFVVGLNGFVKGTPEEKVHALFEIYKSDSMGPKETVAISDLLGLFQGDRHLYQELMRCVDEYFARVELRDESQPTMNGEEFAMTSIAEPHLLDMVSRPIPSRKYASAAHVRDKIRAYIEQKQLNWKKLLQIHRRMVGYARSGSIGSNHSSSSAVSAESGDLQRARTPPQHQSDVATQLQDEQQSVNSQTLAIPAVDFHRILTECLGPSALEDEALMQSLLLAYVATPRERTAPLLQPSPTSNDPFGRAESSTGGFMANPDLLSAGGDHNDELVRRASKFCVVAAYTPVVGCHVTEGATQ